MIDFVNAKFPEPEPIDFHCKDHELDEINACFYGIYEIINSSEKYRKNPYLTSLAFDHIIAKAMLAKETILLTALDDSEVCALSTQEDKPCK